MFVTSGLGGMSGAQAKAAVIAGCIGVVAEVRVQQFLKCWLMSIIDLTVLGGGVETHGNDGTL